MSATSFTRHFHAKKYPTVDGPRVPYSRAPETTNAAVELVTRLWIGEALANPPKRPEHQVIKYRKGVPYLSLERVARPTPCEGCADAACAHHGAMVRKLARRAKRNQKQAGAAT